jgi:two-component system nitrogen regulation sensor histidine kinase NtrY
MEHGKPISFEWKVFLLALAAGLPGGLLAMGLIWFGEYSIKAQWTASLLVLLPWLGLAAVVREKVRFPLRTISNILAGIREGDFSTRARGARRDDALGEVITEVNLLGNTLREQRLEAVEAGALVRTIIEEIELAVYAFDDRMKLRLVNRTGEQLLARSAEQLLGRSATELGLSDYVVGESNHTVERAFPARVGRWGIRRTQFRQDGIPHHLIVVTDLSRTLRDEERQAWQRLVRVLGHEINNSLAPIISISASLKRMVDRGEESAIPIDDLGDGLGVISKRADSLSRFMGAYARLARLPSPTLRRFELGPWLERVSILESSVRVVVRSGPPISIVADSDQLEQVLINLLQNAAESIEIGRGGKSEPSPIEDSVETGISIAWTVSEGRLRIFVTDCGVGLASTKNLFVPFFTTKPKGSGIGLVLCRQIAEAHGGALTLENRDDCCGCVATLELPLERS